MNLKFKKISEKFNNFRNDERIRKFKKFINNSSKEKNKKNSIALAVSIGLFCGLLPAPFQMLSAASVAYFFKVNILVAIFVTLYTNPLTIFPIYFIGYKLGEYTISFFKDNFSSEEFVNLNHFPSIIETDDKLNFIWLLDHSGILIFGNLILGLLLAIFGYLITYFIYVLILKKNKLK